MSNKDNVFIAVNEEVSSLIQQYIIIEIKRVLDKYKSNNNRRNNKYRKFNKQHKQWRAKRGISKWLEHVSKDSKKS